MLTFTKNPPASMKVMTVTEARVVALFRSMSVAPIASPRPCFTSNHLLIKTSYFKLVVFSKSIGEKEAYLSCHNAQKNCKHG